MRRYLGRVTALAAWLAQGVYRGSFGVGRLKGAAMRRASFTTGSRTVCYWIDDSAGDAPWLVFLPGLTADHTLFDAQMAHFSGAANCLVWDAPAHGASRPYPLDFSMDDYARILRAILQAEGIDLDAWLEGFHDTEASVRKTVAAVREHPLMPADVTVRGFIIDSVTGALEEISTFAREENS